MMQEVSSEAWEASSEAARKLVFDHWNFMAGIANKRFPSDRDMADQALSFVLDKMAEEDWKRVKSWDGCGSFATFVGVIASRQMTDFVRSKFGYHRPPQWLQEKEDPLWKKAYKLFAVDKLERQEALEVLYAENAEIHVNTVDEIVHTIYAKCTKQARFAEQNVPVEQIGETAAMESDMEPDELDNKELIEVLMEFIASEQSIDDQQGLPLAVQQRLLQLKNNLQISDEDRLLLRLRYCEGLKIKEIKEQLGLDENLYKRVSTLLSRLKTACVQSGLVTA